MEQIQFIVSTLADNYGFNAKEALEYVLIVRREKSPAYARAIKAIESTKAKITKLQENISTNKARKPEVAKQKLSDLHDKLLEQESKLDNIGKPAPRKPRVAKKEEEEKKEEKKEEEKKDGKRISRMSKTLGDKLESTFKDLNDELNSKTKKGFVSFINELTADDFDAKTLTEHMYDYAVMTVRPAHESEAETLEYDELVKLKNLIDGYSAGIYWDPFGKRFVSGPEATDDDDVDEVEFEDIHYSVCETNGRVYEMSKDGDIFVGFKGIGQFKSM